MSEQITRNAIVGLLGTPDKTEGSLNSPVELEENGIHYNEKWIYDHLSDDPSGAPKRIIYWHRYDFTGTMICKSADAGWVKDTTLLEACKAINARVATVESTHTSSTGNRSYRPASEVRDANDLGGYIEGSKE